MKLYVDNPNPSLDLIARRVVMAAFLYYGLAESIVPDEVFDDWCRVLVKRWHRLDEYRQWQLGDRDSLRATTMHVKVTYASVGGALAWLEAKGGKVRGKVEVKRTWRFSRARQVHWLTPDNFYW